MTPDRAIETAADYADALMTCRRAKHVLILVVLLVLLLQLALFFLVRYDVIDFTPVADPEAAAVTPAPTTAPLDESAAGTQAGGREFNWEIFVHYLIGFTVFLGVSLTGILAIVLLLIVNIMLVGRLIGVGRLTSALIWCLVLLALVFPWQAFLNNVELTWEAVTFKFPGVLYTWPELIHPTQGANFETSPISFAILKWARFVALPLVAVIVLLAVQVKSSRGLKQALGEDLPPPRTEETPVM